MFALPSLPPPWDGLHPLVVHFPIALMFVAPLLVALAAVCRKHTATWLAAGALIMVLAAVGAWLATSTGSAAEDFAERVPGARAILEEHEELGETTQCFAFALAGALVLGTVAFWRWGERSPRGVVVGLGLVYLIASGAGVLVAANAAHQGGRLVHGVGVRARLSDNTAAGPATPTANHEGPARGRDDD